ncbi:hypothetical protein SEA_ATUIN_224 [Arthrobacter phage Atuin]|nr:hypothetical protein SEA_ATUIN_23 [Arthrobacter phage Atuin]
MSSIKKDSVVKIKQSYFDTSLRGRKGTVLSGPSTNAFLGDVVVVALTFGGQVSLSTDYVDLVEEPTVFKKGDSVRFKDTTPNHMFRGKKATIASDTYLSSDGLDDLIDLRYPDGSTYKGAHIVNLEHIEEKSLKEGEEISLEDIEVGMVVKATYESTSGDYVQTSTKQGKVSRIDKDRKGQPYPFVKADVGSVPISIDIDKTVYTLIKDVERIDKISEMLKLSKAGSVVQIEDDGAGKFIQTFVKIDHSIGGAGRWMKMDSRYSSSTLVSESSLRYAMRSLDQLIVSK